MTGSDDVAPPTAAVAVPSPAPPAVPESVPRRVSPTAARQWLVALAAELDAPGAALFAPDADGVLRPLTWVGYTQDLVDTWRRLDLSGTPAGAAYATGKIVVVLDAEAPTEDYPKLLVAPRGPGTALVTVPVPGPTGPAGVLGVSFATAEDLLAAGVRWSQLARDLAALLDQPGDRAGDRTVDPPAGVPAPRPPDMAATGLDALTALATRLLAVASPEDVLDEVSAAALPALGAELVTVCLVERGGETLRLVRSRRTPEAVEAAFETFRRDAALPAREALAERRPVLMRTLDERDRLYPELAPVVVEQQAFATLPLQTPTEDLGVLTFGWLAEQAFDRRQLLRLEAVTAWCTAALQRTKLDSAVRSTAETLQRALLPRLVPVPGWDVAAHYAPATEGTEVGGDWYDVFDLPDGRVGLVLGDVMGKGTAAAAVMGAVRSALRAYASIDPAPDAVLARLDGFVAATAPGQLVTCAYLVLDPATGALQHANAGHPPALVVSPAGPRWLDEPVRPPLAVPLPRGVAPTQPGVGYVAPGEALLLFSDGLVERRGHDLADGLAALAGAARSVLHAPDLRAACSELGDALAHPRRNVDDIAVLALRRLAR